MNSELSLVDNTRFLYMDANWLRTTKTRRPEDVGLSHCFAWLQSFLQVAVALRRTPVVVDRIPFTKIHNKHLPVSEDIDAYCDLNGLEAVSEDGLARRQFPCIKTSDFDIDAFPSNTVRTVIAAPDKQSTLISADDDKHTVLAIEYPSVHLCVFETPHAPTANRSWRVAPLPFSRNIRQLGDAVVADMSKDGGYMAVKVRHKHQFVFFSSPTQRNLWHRARMYAEISVYNLRATLRHIPPETPIYLMMDARNERFYDSLLRHYPKLRLYYDYPDLYRLRHPVDGEAPNNYILYATEIHIFQHARAGFSNRPPHLTPDNVYELRKPGALLTLLCLPHSTWEWIRHSRIKKFIMRRLRKLRKR